MEEIEQNKENKKDKKFLKKKKLRQEKSEQSQKKSQSSHSDHNKILVCWLEPPIYIMAPTTNENRQQTSFPTNKSETRKFLLECGGKVVGACCNKCYSTVEKIFVK